MRKLLCAILGHRWYVENLGDHDPTVCTRCFRLEP